MPDLLTDAEREIEERCARATAGPWWRTDPPWGQGTTVHAGPSDDPHAATCYIADGDIMADSLVADKVVENMEFIAHARQDIPTLLTALRAEREQRVKLEERWRDDIRTLAADVATVREENIALRREKAELEERVNSLEADNHRMRLGDMSTYDYHRLIEWINNPERKCPSAAFTAGALRTAALAVQDSGVLSTPNPGERT